MAEPGHETSQGLCDPAVQRCGHPSVRLGEVPDSRQEGLRDRLGPATIGRSVIHDDHLDPGEVLGERALDCLRQEVGPVVDRDDD